MRPFLFGLLVMATCAVHAHDALDFRVQARDVQVVFVDLQPELTKASHTVAPQALATNSRVLAKIAGITNVPVTFSTVSVAGQPGHVLPELLPYANAGNVYPRVPAGTFMDPAFTAGLKAHHRKVLVVSGYATEVAVLQTVLGALDAGYRVYIVVDAVGSKSNRTEQAAFDEMQQAGATPISVLALAGMLAPDFTKPPGANVLATFDELVPLN